MKKHTTCLIVEGDDLEVVIGGGWLGWAQRHLGWNRGRRIAVVTGNNNRVEVGNTGRVTMQDNDPIDR